MLNKVDVGSGAGCLSRGGARDALQELIGLPISLQWSKKVNVQVKEMSIQKRISLCDFQEIHEDRSLSLIV